MKQAAMLTILALIPVVVSAQELPAGAWSSAEARTILDASRTIHLDPDLSDLTAGERKAVDLLVQAGIILHKLYLDAKHPEALSSLRALQVMDAENPTTATADLLKLYRYSQGPIATTLDNERKAFLPVEPESPTRNVYPMGATRAEIDAYLARHPEMTGEILGERTLVRRTTPGNVRRDLAMLARYPALHTLHPGLGVQLRTALGDADDGQSVRAG